MDVDATQGHLVLKDGSLELLGPWRIIFVVFVTYSMLPLSLRWCLLCGGLSSIGHVLTLVFWAPRDAQDFALKVRHWLFLL